MQEKTELFLVSYLDRMRPLYRTLDPHAAHRIALALLSFKHGLFEETVQRSDQASDALGGSGSTSAVRTALAVMRTRADDLQAHGAITVPLPRFSDADRNELALPLPDADVDDPEHLTLANALLLLYAAGLAASPRDIQALEEQQRYIVQTLGPYKKQIEAGVS